jgi:hypothetical protein
MSRKEVNAPMISRESLEGAFLYMGILDAYEAVGAELIGPNVLEEHVLPRMVYYVREFLPAIFSTRGDTDQLVSELSVFLSQFKGMIDQARETGNVEFTIEDVWELRAAIFGYESVFLDILGEVAIKNYVFTRIADILSSYLPEAILSHELPLEKKLEAYVNYIQAKKFAGYARFDMKANQVSITTNRCVFSRIHNSDAYRDAKTRFCPWGMIGSAIIASHEGKETTIDSCLFTTTGSITHISNK